MSVLTTRSQEYRNACVWFCWCRSRDSDVEPGCIAPCLQADTLYIKQSFCISTDFNKEDDLQFFVQPYLFEPEYPDDELREMDVLRQNAGSCIKAGLDWFGFVDLKLIL